MFYKNGELVDSNIQMGNYTSYPSSFLVVDPDGIYSKHYYAGTQRIAARLGNQKADELFMDKKSQTTGLMSNNSESTTNAYPDEDDLMLLQQQDLQQYLDQAEITATLSFAQYNPATDQETSEEDSLEQTQGGYGTMAEDLIYYYHPDHLGTATYLTDINGLPYEFFLNLPFGETMAEQHSQTGDYSNRWKFTGHELDRETGLYYAGARYYDPKLSIFISVDPLAEQAPDWTPYRYGFNNPVRMTDPTGMYEEDSIHTDERGNVIAKYDDGDDGVYMHSNNTTKSQIDKQRKDNKNTGGKGTRIGEIGGVIDANTIYTNTLSENIDESKDIWNPFTFKDYVKSFGKWDLKNNKKTIYGLANDGKTQFSFQGELMESQDIGNHHFGAVALAYGLFPSETFILKEAGDYQIKSGTSKPEWQVYGTERVPTYTKTGNVIWTDRKVMLPPYGDDPRDQKWIKSGFQYYKNNR